MQKTFVCIFLSIFLCSPMLHSKTFKVYDRQSKLNAFSGYLITGVGLCGICINILQAYKTCIDLPYTKRSINPREKGLLLLLLLAHGSSSPFERDEDITPSLLRFNVMDMLIHYLTITLGLSLTIDQQPILTLSQEDQFLCYQGTTVPFDDITHIEECVTHTEGCNNAILVHISPEAGVPGDMLIIDPAKLSINYHKLMKEFLTIKSLIRCRVVPPTSYSNKADS